MTVESPQAPPKNKLDTAANIAIIITCVLVVAMLAYKTFYVPKPPPPPGIVQKGETLKALQAVLREGSDRTLVMAVAPGCHFCNDSLPFYKQLMEERNGRKSAVQVIVAVPDQDPEATRKAEQAKFSGAGVSPDQMVNLNFAALKVPGTPTLMLVDRGGKVLDVWVGKLDPDGEKSVLARL